MTTLLPKDADNNIIPALRLAEGKAHQITSSGTAITNSNAFDENTKIISLFATEAVFIKFGDVGVTATNTDHFFPAGVYYDVAISGGAGKAAHTPYVSVLSVSADATLFISEKQ